MGICNISFQTLRRIPYERQKDLIDNRIKLMYFFIRIAVAQVTAGGKVSSLVIRRVTPQQFRSAPMARHRKCRLAMCRLERIEICAKSIGTLFALNGSSHLGQL